MFFDRIYIFFFFFFFFHLNILRGAAPSMDAPPLLFRVQLINSILIINLAVE